MDSISQSVLKTILYADVFKYALTADELWLRLQSPKPITRAALDKATQSLIQKKILTQDQGYIFPAQKTQRAHRRLLGQQDFEAKQLHIQRFLPLITWVPWLKGIFLTGSVAVQNSRAGDDIDLMIITAANRLWLTRLSLILVMELWGTRRHPHANQTANQFCLNLFLEPASLPLPKSMHNLYIAHEVIQARPVWVRSHIDQVFLAKNRWIRRYLPMAMKRPEEESGLRLEISSSPSLRVEDRPRVVRSQKSEIITNYKLQITNKNPNTKYQIPNLSLKSQLSSPACRPCLPTGRQAWLNSYILALLRHFTENALTVANIICYQLQRWYMQRHQTTERVGLRYAFFHPRPTKDLIETRFEARKKQFGLV